MKQIIKIIFNDKYISDVIKYECKVGMTREDRINVLNKKLKQNIIKYSVLIFISLIALILFLSINNYICLIVSVLSLISALFLYFEDIKKYDNLEKQEKKLIKKSLPELILLFINVHYKNSNELNSLQEANIMLKNKYLKSEISKLIYDLNNVSDSSILVMNKEKKKILEEFNEKINTIDSDFFTSKLYDLMVNGYNAGILDDLEKIVIRSKQKLINSNIEKGVFQVTKTHSTIFLLLPLSLGYIVISLLLTLDF